MPGTPDGTVRSDRSPRAVPVDLSARAQAGCSPTTSLLTVLVTLTIAVLLSLVVAAHAFLRRRDVPGTPDETARGDRSPRAVPVDLSARTQAGCSPTTSIHRVVVTLTIAVLLSVVVAARAIVHAGAGMPDGPMRTLTLAIGQATLRVAEVTHVTWPWDRLAAALGNAPQPAVPPLLASGSAAAPRPQATPTPPAQTPQVGAVLIGASPPPLTSSRGKIQQALADPPGKQEPTRHLTPTDAAREVRPVLEPKRNL